MPTESNSERDSCMGKRKAGLAMQAPRLGLMTSFGDSYEKMSPLEPSQRKTGSDFSNVS